MKVRPRIIGIVCIAISVVLLLDSFYTESILLLNYNVPVAGICLLFVVFAVAFFEYADKYDINSQKKISSEVTEQIDDLTAALASDLKREDKIKTELKKDMASMTSDLKRQDKTLATGLKNQGKTLASNVKKQGKMNIEVKKKIKDLSSEVKKPKPNPSLPKPAAKPAAPKKKN